MGIQKPEISIIEIVKIVNNTLISIYSRMLTRRRGGILLFRYS